MGGCHFQSALRGRFSKVLRSVLPFLGAVAPTVEGWVQIWVLAALAPWLWVQLKQLELQVLWFQFILQVQIAKEEQALALLTIYSHLSKGGGIELERHLHHNNSPVTKPCFQGVHNTFVQVGEKQTFYKDASCTLRTSKQPNRKYQQMV